MESSHCVLSPPEEDIHEVTPEKEVIYNHQIAGLFLRVLASTGKRIGS
jgi:hypothetical protein